MFGRKLKVIKIKWLSLSHCAVKPLWLSTSQKWLCEVGGSIIAILVYFYHFSKSDYFPPCRNFACLQCSNSPVWYLSFVLCPYFNFFLLIIFCCCFCLCLPFFHPWHSCCVKIKMQAAIPPFLFATLCGCLQAENIHTTGVWTVRQAMAIKHQWSSSIWEQLHTLSKCVLCFKKRKRDTGGFAWSLKKGSEMYILSILY